jgi:hypothetical protein
MNRRDMLKVAGSTAAMSILGGIPLDLSAEYKAGKVFGRNSKKIMAIVTTLPAEF